MDDSSQEDFHNETDVSFEDENNYESIHIEEEENVETDMDISLEDNADEEERDRRDDEDEENLSSEYISAESANDYSTDDNNFENGHIQEEEQDEYEEEENVDEDMDISLEDNVDEEEEDRRENDEDEGNLLNEDSSEVSSNDSSTDEDDDYDGGRGALFQGCGDNVRMQADLQNDVNVKALDNFITALARNVAFNESYVSLMAVTRWFKQIYLACDIPISKTQLWKTLNRDTSNLIYSVYCTMCKEKVGDGKLATRRCNCGKCGPNEDKSNLGTFIHIRLIPQLHDFFQVPNIAKSLRYKHDRVKINPDNIEDIYDGENYRKLSEEGNFLSNEYNFSFTLWVDGVALAKSSNASACPILLHINELAPYARIKHAFLIGLYIGNKKPEITTHMIPIVKELKKLHETGIKWRPEGPEGPEVVSKFATVIFTADSVAKPEVLRTSAHNSYNPCPRCYVIGEWENKMIFPYSEIILRTHDQILEDMQEAVLHGVEVNGIKGCSALAALPEFDLAEGVVHDDVHGYYLGCAKQITTHMLEDTKTKWYIGDKINVMDKKLKEIRLPSRISRRPRSISTFHKWKATEWRNWLLYIGPVCLENVLKEPYFSNFMLLSKAVFILNNTSISEEDLNLSRTCLTAFVATANIYGNSNMTFNVHLSQHGPDSVKCWGPSWAYSTFPFESFCCKLKKDVTSAHMRADQVVTRFFLKKYVEGAVYTENITEKAKNEVKILLGLKDDPIAPGMFPGHYFTGVGRAQQRRVTNEEIVDIREAGEVIRENTIVFLHKKAKIHGVNYQVHDNVKRKYCDSIAYNGEIFFSILRFLSYRDGERTVSGFIGKKYETMENLYRTNHIKRVVETNQTTFVSFNDVTVPGIVFTIKNTTFAIPISNISSID